MEGAIQYFTVQAVTPREALEKMKRQYGPEARILTHKNIRRGGLFGLFAREGVEITGYVPGSSLRPSAQPFSGGADSGTRLSANGMASNRASVGRQAGIEETKKKILAEARREQAFQLILKEIQSLKENLNDPYNLSVDARREQHPQIEKISELMRCNDFTEDFLEEILRRIRREFSLEDLAQESVLQNSVLEWVGEKIGICPPIPSQGEKIGIFIIIGPTGVGKTTTIAKLAAIYGVGNNRVNGRNVRIVTIDNYRIAARRQIETYAEIMRVPCSFVESLGDFKKVIAMSKEGELILVDTIGKSPRNLGKLAEMQEIIDAAGPLSEIHLAISSTTKASDVEDILRQFEPFRYKAVILTKLDETLRIGNVISILAKMNKPISYLADGQGVPQDIEEASVIRLLMNLEGFRINRERLEEKFGKREKILDRYWS